MSPELINGQPYDIKSDVWALGCLIYELCAGQYVFSLCSRAVADEKSQSAVSRSSNAAGTRRTDSRRQDPRPTETLHPAFGSSSPSNAQAKRLSFSLEISSMNNVDRPATAEASTKYFADQSAR